MKIGTRTNPNGCAKHDEAWYLGLECHVCRLSAELNQAYEALRDMQKEVIRLLNLLKDLEDNFRTQAQLAAKLTLEEMEKLKQCKPS